MTSHVFEKYCKQIRARVTSGTTSARVVVATMSQDIVEHLDLRMIKCRNFLNCFACVAQMAINPTNSQKFCMHGHTSNKFSELLHAWDRWP